MIAPLTLTQRLIICVPLIAIPERRALHLFMVELERGEHGLDMISNDTVDKARITVPKAKSASVFAAARGQRHGVREPRRTSSFRPAG
jgi:hypothetical protein